MRTRTVLAASCSLPLAIGVITAASAQEILRSSPAGSSQSLQPLRTGQEAPTARAETVVSRSRPELDPLGVRAGSFLIYPKLAVNQSYEDNIFAERAHVKGDFITDVKPSVAVESNWANHALNVSSGADLGFYSTYTRQDYQDWFVKSDGRLDITRDSALFAGGGYAREHEEPGDPDAIAGAETPTEYDLIDGFVRHAQRFGRFRGIAEGQVVRLDYLKVNTGDGPEQSTDDRDRTYYSGGYQLGYELFPQYEVFVRANGNTRRYDKRTEVSATESYSRNSDGFTAVGGVSLDLGGLLFGDVYAGYMQQDFSHDFNDVSGPTAGGTLTYNVTTLTTLNARVARTIEDTTQEDSPAVVRTSGGISADHELLRNLIVSSALTVTHDAYADVTRDDYYYVAGLGAKYSMNRNLAGTFGYQFVRHTTGGSDTTDNSYYQNLIRIGLEAQL